MRQGAYGMRKAVPCCVKASSKAAVNGCAGVSTNCTSLARLTPFCSRSRPCAFSILCRFLLGALFAFFLVLTVDQREGKP